MATKGEAWPGIMDGEEWGRLEAGFDAQLSLAEGVTLVFSARGEPLQGALSPVGRYFDFLDARWLAMTAQTLTLELKCPLTPTLPAGWRAPCTGKSLPGACSPSCCCEHDASARITPT